MRTLMVMREPRSRSRHSGWLLLVALMSIPAWAGEAAACTCVDWPADRRMTEADHVFIGRAGKRRLVGEEEVLRFSGVHALKGEVAPDYELHRRTDRPCERSFQEGELALVFLVRGQAPICNGNIDLDKLMPTLGEYLGHGAEGSAVPTREAIKLALSGRLGKARKLEIYFPPLVGKTLVVGSTQVKFIDGRPDEVPVLSSTTKGELTYLSLRRPDGTAAAILVARERGKLVVLHALERDLKLR